jgi:hypothetical protein
VAANIVPPMTSWGRRTCALLVLSLLVGALALVGAAPPASAEVDTTPCRVRMVTGRGSGGVLHSFGGDLTADGRRVTFSSERNLSGQNADANAEVFVADLVTGTIRQVTHSAPPTFVSALATSGDGERVAVLSNLATPSNADGQEELFLVDAATGAMDQVTDGLVHQGVDVEMDEAGDRLVFRAKGVTGGDGSHEEIWLYDASADEITQVSVPHVNTNRTVSTPAISDDGTIVTYTSNRDDLALGTTARGVYQYRPDTDERSRATPVTQQAGRQLAVDGEGDTFLMVGENDLDGVVGPDDPAADEWLNLVQTGGAATQLWAASGEDGSGRLALDDDGDAAFALTYPGLHPGQTTFRYRPDGSRRPVITGMGGGVDDVALGGTRVVLSGGGDPLGLNPQKTSEVYVADCTSFRDVSPTHPFIADVEWMATEGLSEGYAGATFRPTTPVSRQAAVSFLHRLAGAPEVVAPNPPTFDDVGASHPFLEEVEWAAAEGITTGYLDGTFRPLAPVTRQAFAAFLLGDQPFDPPASATFPDVPASHPFFDAIEWASSEGITTGYADGTFRPAAVVSRQAAAAQLHRLAELD